MNAEEGETMIDGAKSSQGPDDSSPYKHLPMMLVTCTILGLWASYVQWHLVRVLQIGVNPIMVDESMHLRGTTQAIGFHVALLMLFVSYGLAMTVSPGAVPDDDPMWDYGHRDSEHVLSRMYTLKENKGKTGDRRHCKWCGKYKPDRCHHCRVCKRCVLRMDHHCPWILNCVGFHNYKYFFLVVFYSMVCSQTIVWTMLETVFDVINRDADFREMFAVIYTETIAMFLSGILTVFLGFHCWLMSMSMTTIEWCEKHSKNEEGSGSTASLYDVGAYGNIKAVLGDNPLLWLIPIGGPSGDGLTYVTAVQSEGHPTQPSRRQSAEPEAAESGKAGLFGGQSWFS